MLVQFSLMIEDKLYLLFANKGKINMDNISNIIISLIKYLNWPVILMIIILSFKNEIKLLSKKILENFDRILHLNIGKDGLSLDLQKVMESLREDENNKDIKIIGKGNGIKWSDDIGSSELWNNGIRIYKFTALIYKNIDNIVTFPCAFKSLIALNIIGDFEYKLLKVTQANFTIKINEIINSTASNNTIVIEVIVSGIM